MFSQYNIVMSENFTPKVNSETRWSRLKDFADYHQGALIFGPLAVLATAVHTLVNIENGKAREERQQIVENEMIQEGLRPVGEGLLLSNRTQYITDILVGETCVIDNVSVFYTPQPDESIETNYYEYINTAGDKVSFVDLSGLLYTTRGNPCGETTATQLP
jgi:hypothetical protein